MAFDTPPRCVVCGYGIGVQALDVFVAGRLTLDAKVCVKHRLEALEAVEKALDFNVAIRR